MAELYVNVNGTWKQASNYYVNVNGTWKEGSELHAKVSSAWKESGGVYGGTSGIVSTNIVLDLDASNTNSYSGSGTTWTDISGNSNDATLVNGPTFNSTHGGSIVFDGTNDSVTISGMSSFAPSAVTFEVWFLNTPASGYKGLIDKGRDNYEGYSLAASSSKVQWKARVGSSNEVALDTEEYQDSVWTHAVGTYDGTDLKLYVDGVLKTTTNSSGTLGSNSLGITIGSTNDNLYFDGRISQARIYSSALSASEVLQNFNATKTNYTTLITSNLVLHLNAGDSSSYSGSGTTWSDISGNNNDFTLTNGPTYSSDFGGVIVFDGSDDYASSANDVADFQWGTGAYSYGVWVNADTLTSSGANGFLAFYGDNGATTQKSSQIYVISGNLKHIILDGGTSYILNSSQTISTGTWYYIMFVNPNDGSTDGAKLYVNGSSVGSQTLSALDYGSTLRFARTPKTRSTAYLDGSVAQVHIYKGKALSASEVLQNYNATKSNYTLVTTNLVLHLDTTNSSSYSGSGTTWTDLSGEGNHATLVNSPAFFTNNGGYLDFDGSNEYATLPDMDLTGNELTFSIWTNATSTSQATSLIFLGDSTAPHGNGRIINVHLPYNGFYYFDKGHDGSSSASYDRIYGTVASSDYYNQWVNWSFTANASTGSMKIYRNGSLYASGTGKTKTFSDSDGDMKYIGYNGNNYYQGGISKILLYKKELTASEVLNNYNIEKSTYGH